ncbi:MAG: hypothetical protein R6V62_03125, partial [Candidatus Fermentibacteraceae bacterium]
MRLQLFLMAVIVFLAGCRVVSDEDGQVSENAAPGRSSPFQSVDSLIQTGRQDAAVRQLRSLWSGLGSPEPLRGDFLWRFVGCYNGRGQSDRCVTVLDSLSGSGWGDLSGWKVSVLELNRRKDEALPLAADDYLLEAWVRRDNPESLPQRVVPAPDGPAERTVRVLLTDPGSLTQAQITVAAQDAQLFP